MVRNNSNRLQLSGFFKAHGPIVVHGKWATQRKGKHTDCLPRLIRDLRFLLLRAPPASGTDRGRGEDQPQWRLKVRRPGELPKPPYVLSVLRLVLRQHPRSPVVPSRPVAGRALLLFALSCATLLGSDWPHLLGPTRDAVYAGPALADKWPADGPRVVWKLDVGEGYSSPVVAEGRLIQCHRLDDQLQVECLDPATGTRHWTFKHAMNFRDGASFDHGPRPTPAIRGGRVYVHNTDGYLVCLDLKSGAKVWSRHVKAEFKTSATWHGCAGSPLLTGKSLILNVGATNAGGIVAFALEDGHTLWQVTGEKASASTPILKNLDGKNQIIIVTREALHGLDPDTGKDFWRLPTRKQTSGNVYAASPVVFDDKIFLSGWYKLGAMLIHVKNDQPETLWHIDDAISSHYTCTLVRDGYAYGFHGHAWERGGPNLRCIELATGKVMWEEPKLGSGTIVRAGDQFVILSDTGELQLAHATTKEFKVKHRAQIVSRPTRSYPAIADGFAFLKGPRQLVCVDLRANQSR